MRRGIIAVVTVLVIGLCLPGVVSGTTDATGVSLDEPAAVSDGVDEDDEDEANDEETDNKSTGGFGQQVTSFVQSTSAETDGAVEQGMWESRVAEDATPEAIDERGARLEERLAAAQTEQERLRAARENGSISQMEYASRMAQVNGEIRSIAAAADDTAAVAKDTGADVESIEAVRRSAKEKSGSPVDVPGVPPTERGNDPSTAADDTPAGDTPTGDTPADGTPANNTPANGPPANETPADNAPANGTPANNTPANDAPADNAPVSDEGADDSPVRNASTDAPGRSSSAGKSSKDDAPDPQRNNDFDGLESLDAASVADGESGIGRAAAPETGFSLGQ